MSASKSKHQNKKVSLMLSNGLYVISAKHRIGTSLFVLYLTDFAVNARISFDAEAMKVLPNKYNIELDGKDADALLKKLEWNKKVEVAAPVVVPVIVEAKMPVSDWGF